MIFFTYLITFLCTYYMNTESLEMYSLLIAVNGSLTEDYNMKNIEDYNMKNIEDYHMKNIEDYNM